jgi:Radical SAM superfamily
MFVYVDYHRRGRRNRYAFQPQIGPLIAGLLPREAQIEIINETWSGPDWNRDYDLLFISCAHSDFDRARQISHYWRRRGAKTVFGGTLASTYPELCSPYFDAIAIGDPEGSVRRIYDDFCRGELQSTYVSPPYDPAQVPTPRFDLIADKAWHPLVFEATRGCPFTCEFCVLTGLGTRYHTRPVERVLHDIAQGQAQLAGRVPAYKRRVVGFCDNNVGGNLVYLRELCAALTPLNIQWYGAATFNVVSNPDLVRLMARSGCRALFVGLESFNPATIAAMNKHQNVVRKIRIMIDRCRDEGILIISGLMVSPLTDDVEYIRAIPDYLRASGLHLPTFICFETPIPGTPHFQRLAMQSEPVLLPNALLRDFAGYTLTVRPKHAPIDEFLAAYRATVETVYSARNKFAKLADDLPRFLKRGHWLSAVIDAGDVFAANSPPAPERTLIAGSDLPPPERVPLTDADFNSEEERRDILEPCRVTDGAGRVLAPWLRPSPVFASARKGNPAAIRGEQQLAARG